MAEVGADRRYPVSAALRLRYQSEYVEAAQRSRSPTGEIRGDASGFAAVEQLGRRAPSPFFLEIDVGERVIVVVADDETLPLELRVGIFNGPGRREAAGVGQGDGS